MSYTENNKTYFLTVKSVGNGIIDMSMNEFHEDLESLRKEVGGNIEHFIISEELQAHHIDMWIDDEGKLKDLQTTMLLCDNEGHVIDDIRGNCVFTKFDDKGYTWGLDNEALEIVRDWLYHVPIVQYRDSEDGSTGYAIMVKGFYSVSERMGL